jgi:hypothetical protein
MAAKVPKNIRFRPDQIAALTKLQTVETDFSALVRTAVDRYLSGDSIRIQEKPAHYQTVRHLEKAAKSFNKTRKRQAKRKSA